MQQQVPQIMTPLPLASHTQSAAVGGQLVALGGQLQTLTGRAGQMLLVPLDGHGLMPTGQLSQQLPATG